jgi:hypothetical protein
LKPRQKFLELSDALIIKSNRILTKVLEREASLTREELVRVFGNAGIRTDENRLSHMMVCAELDAIVCSGPMLPAYDEFLIAYSDRSRRLA